MSTISGELCPKSSVFCCSIVERPRDLERVSKALVKIGTRLLSKRMSMLAVGMLMLVAETSMKMFRAETLEVRVRMSWGLGSCGGFVSHECCP